MKPKLADIAPRPGRWPRSRHDLHRLGLLGLGETGAWIVGEVPQGLPPLTMPSFSPDLWAS
jgi:SulP family sulfate permease